MHTGPDLAIIADRGRLGLPLALGPFGAPKSPTEDGRGETPLDGSLAGAHGKRRAHVEDKAKSRSCPRP